MNKKQINNLTQQIIRLKRQKYPVLVIVLIVVASLLVSNDWLQNYLFPKAADECEVIKIYDGDTMTLQCPNSSEPTKVRMYCIDTPEMKQSPWGIQARDHLRSITGKTVRLVAIDKDRYGRVVGEVFDGDVNLNLAQVKAGKAAVYHTYCDKPEYNQAERESKQARLGIWAEAGMQQTPWDWRRAQR
jgi:endonuclease YncB( thermonuclease family)